MKKTMFVIMWLFLMGCATALRPGAERVMIITNNPDLSQYEYLGDITATKDGVSQGQAVESVRAIIRNKASVMGADIVTIDTSNQYGYEITMSGRAFKKKEK